MEQSPQNPGAPAQASHLPENTAPSNAAQGHTAQSTTVESAAVEALQYLPQPPSRVPRKTPP